MRLWLTVVLALLGVVTAHVVRPLQTLMRRGGEASRRPQDTSDGDLGVLIHTVHPNPRRYEALVAALTSEDLVFDYDRSAMMERWRVRTAGTDRIDLLLEPEFERVSESGRRDGFFSSAHQIFGCYSGRIAPDGGKPIEIRDLFGWIEEHEARW